MQRSRITSTPSSGGCSTARTSSRSSMIFVSTPRDSSSASRSFSSTRTRDRRTPTRGLFTPVLLRLRRKGEREGCGLLHFQLGAAIGAGHDLAFDGVGADRDLGIALGALRHDPPPPIGGSAPKPRTAPSRNHEISLRRL